MTGRIQFGMFEFDASTGELFREGRAIRLQPQPARVLAFLVSRAGEVVSRDELRQTIWSDGTFVDFERGLNFCIAQIRSALGDAAESPRFIETLPKRGYRFIAPVKALAGPPSSDAPPLAEAVPGVIQQRLRRGRTAAIALGAAALVLAAILVSMAGGDSRIRVAVLPFDNETGQQAFGDLAQGIADATVARLASPERVARLAVVGNSAALRRPRAFRDLKAIGQEASVAYVVLAQVKRDESRVRLIAHLIRVSDEAHVWAQTFDRASFTLEAQAEIAEAIAKAVSEKLRTAN